MAMMPTMHTTVIQRQKESRLSKAG